MFGNLSMWEILIILAVVLLIFGARRLPEIGASMGKGIREFKRSLTDVNEAITGPDRADRLPPGEQQRRATTSTDDSEPEPKRLLR